MNTFSFLKRYDESLYEIAEDIENLIYEHPNSAANKMRIFIEKMIDTIINIEGFDKNNFIEKKLFDKIKLLGQNYLEEETIAKFHKIRKIGNRASHESNMNKQEVLEVHKEVFKLAVWFVELYIDYSFEEPKYEKPKKKNERYELYKKTKGSHLLYQLTRLSIPAKEAVVGPNRFNDFKKYLHVETKIQKEMENILEKTKNGHQNKLVLLCGSVGDGKSHLISYLNNFKSSLLENFHIHNDATASFNPEDTDIDTLYRLLSPYKDEQIEDSRENILLAINLGVLNKFLEDSRIEEFGEFERFIESSKLFEENNSTLNVESEYFEIINFTDYSPFSLNEEGPKSDLIEGLLTNLCREDEENPFYSSYLKDIDKSEFYTILNNYEILNQSIFKRRLINLIIKVIIKDKIFLPIRDLLDLFYNIIVPPEYERDDMIFSDFENFKEKAIEKKLGNHTVNLLFDYPNRSNFLEGLNENDPYNINKKILDNKILSLSNSKDIHGFFSENLDIDLDILGIDYLKNLDDFKELDEELQTLVFKTFIRSFYFFNIDAESHFDDEEYYNFMTYLFSFYTGNKKGLKDIQKKLIDTVSRWNGEVPGNERYKYMDSKFKKIKIAQKLNIESYTEHIEYEQKEIVNKFKLYFVLALKSKNQNEEVAKINIDFPLYAFIEDINKGYIQTSTDKEESIKLVKFIDEVMSFGDGDQEVLLNDIEDDGFYIFEYDEAFEFFNFKEC
ncbi:MAG: DNA phosphorothioation-dependent restriction protein DptF [Bacillota bacterium]